MPKPNSFEQLRSDLVDLGARIDATIQEFDEQGILHGPARVAAADFKMQHERAAVKAVSGHVGAVGAITDDLTAEVRILKDTFERWLARIDAGSERKST